MAFSLRPADVLAFGLLQTALIVSFQPAAAQSSPAPTHVFLSPALLPNSFGGWTSAAAPATSTDPAAADPANASVLKEYGLQKVASGSFRHGAATMTVKAMQFVDATGAYGAFTFYRKPEMHPGDIGRETGAANNEIVFWTSTTFVDATAAHIGPEERAALKALAAVLPKNAGPEGVPPSLPRYLPAEGLDKSSMHYAIGPDAYMKTGGVLPIEVIDFSRDAEAVTAKYPRGAGEAMLTILEYPTPQMAADRAKAIDALIRNAQSNGGSLPPSLQKGNAAALAVKPSGPLVAFTSGDLSAEEAAALLNGVKYEAAVTVDHTQPSNNEVRKTAKLLEGIVYLTCILGGAAVLLGIFLGGGRAIIRIARGKSPSVMNDEEFISLKLGS